MSSSEILKEKIYIGEGLVNRIRIALCVLFVAAATLASFSQPRALVLTYMIATSIYIISTISSIVLIKKKIASIRLIYISAFIDALLISSVRITPIFLSPTGGEYIIREKTLFTILFIFVAMIPLRFNQKFAFTNGIVLFLSQIILEVMAFQFGNLTLVGKEKANSPNEIPMRNIINTDLFYLGTIYISYLVSTVSSKNLIKSIQSETIAISSLKKNEEIVNNLKQSGETLAEVKIKIADTIDSFRRSTMEQASISEESSAAMEEIAAASRNITTSTNQQRTLSENATSLTKEMENRFSNLKKVIISSEEIISKINKIIEHGISVMEETKNSMDEIKVSSNQISKVVVVMKEIAYQTNLLSLNAAIEAARAGESGKGFAVVADEVGKLAQKSSSHTKDITENVKRSLEKVHFGNESVQSVMQIFNQIVTEFQQMDIIRKSENESLELFEKNKTHLDTSIQEISDQANGIQLATSEQESAVNETTQAVAKISEQASEQASAIEDLVSLIDFLNEIQSLINKLSSSQNDFQTT